MRRQREAGQALVLTETALVVLIGFVGLGIDMGVMRYEKRLQQTAADAAATAGASNLGFGGIQAAAQNAAASNGFTDNTGGGACATPPTNLSEGQITVTVCNGPSTGPHASDNKYVEAFVSAGQPTYFMKIVGVNSETITARAVATNYSGAGGTSGGPNTGCLYTLGPPTFSIEGASINGSAVLNAPTCGILDNGNYNSKGNKLIVNAGTFGVSGTGSTTGGGGNVNCSAGTTSCPTYGAPATSDPMGSLTGPCPTTCTQAGNSVSIGGKGKFTGTGVTYANGQFTVSPGTYTDMTINGVSSDQVVFSPGLYIFDGTGSNAGLSIPGNATISGAGVTFYFTNNATVQVTGTPTLDLTAPSSGTYADILMWQDTADANTGPFPNGPLLNGNSGSQFNGILYFPADQLTFSGNSTGYSVSVVISDSLALSGNPTVNFTGTTGLPGPLPPGSTFGIGRAFLVE